MTDAIQVVTTTEKREDAEKIARGLIERKLAACVQISSIDSVYRWQGEIESAAEFRCLIKTHATLFDNVERAIQEMHPYDLPQIVALPIVRGSRDYLNWLSQEVACSDD